MRIQMKTILYNPIFINPQAYYVFPSLNGQLVEQKDTAIEPAKYSGIIEVKVIANGDIKLVRYYSNTNKIDLSEFKDSWIRINLYTDLGAVVLGEWKLQVSTPVPPEVDYIALIRNTTLIQNKTLIKNNYGKDI